MPQIRFLIIQILLLVVFIQLIRKKITLIEVYAFFIPFFGIDFEIGIRFTISQFILLLLNVILVIKLYTHKESVSFSRFNFHITLFLLYIFISSAIISNFDIHYIDTMNPNFLRNEGRYISQIINYSLLFSIFYIIPNYLKNKDALISTFRMFLFGILVVGILGFFQEGVYVLTGNDIFPLITRDNDARVAGNFGYFGVSMIRVGSLAGEPKSLGMFVALGFILIYDANKLGYKFFKRDNLIKPFFFIVLVLTLSTSGFLLFIILLGLSEILLSIYNRKKKMSFTSVFTFIALLVFLFAFSDPLENIVQDRIMERDLANEDYDITVKKFLQDHPKWLILGSGLGNIHNLAAGYIPEEASFYMSDTIFVAKSGYLRLISETGIVGFLLFCWFNLIIILKKIKEFKYSNNKIFFLFSIASILLSISYMARGNYVIEAYLFILAITNSLSLPDLFTHQSLSAKNA